MTGAAKESMPAGTTAGTPQILLAHHLKHLKLPTVLREYDKVARECARNSCSPSCASGDSASRSPRRKRS